MTDEQAEKPFRGTLNDYQIVECASATLAIGVLDHDPLGVFEDGTEIHTSRIQIHHISEHMIETRNTRYKLGTRLITEDIYI